ncbi:hypothetical protein SELMODRAFT_443265 [Selaginella moellendorffii]|uniref:Peptidase S9A N-terminal domain-containing protein n=1 Tax=Selaginella moellendorffii TaxID=88036 RepID=D8RZZ4_SELML|nr:hypothetical protein SELMODRAFT_443265 [Selaginella moellendorffii]
MSLLPSTLGVFKLSRDYKLLAYTIDLGGNEMFTLFIKDLETDSLLLEHKTDGVVSVEWSDTGEYLYYTCSDVAHRPHRVLLWNLRSKDDDIAIYHDDNPKNFVDVTRTKNWQYVLINVNSKTSSEVFLVYPKTSATTLRKVADRVDGIQYFVEHHEEHLYILTNFLGDKKLASLGNNYRLVRCKTDSLTSKAWEEVVPVESENWIEDMDIFAKHLILYRRQNGLPIVHDFNLDMFGNIKIGHVTKSGEIAGPRTLEHMVDVYLHLEGDRLLSQRLLRSLKNRFASTKEYRSACLRWSTTVYER